jgi:hypothetical protein
LRHALGEFCAEFQVMEPGMFDFYRGMTWFLKVQRYDNQEQLIADLGERVIRLAETKVQELRGPSRGPFGP